MHICYLSHNRFPSTSLFAESEEDLMQGICQFLSDTLEEDPPNSTKIDLFTKECREKWSSLMMAVESFDLLPSAVCAIEDTLGNVHLMDEDDPNLPELLLQHIQDTPDIIDVHSPEGSLAVSVEMAKAILAMNGSMVATLRPMSINELLCGPKNTRETEVTL